MFLVIFKISCNASFFYPILLYSSSGQLFWSSCILKKFIENKAVQSVESYMGMVFVFLLKVNLLFLVMVTQVSIWKLDTLLKTRIFVNALQISTFIVSKTSKYSILFEKYCLFFIYFIAFLFDKQSCEASAIFKTFRDLECTDSIYSLLFVSILFPRNWVMAPWLGSLFLKLPPLN